ncbi:MAG: NfeD family protein [Pseudomonadota bacterium]
MWEQMTLNHWAWAGIGAALVALEMVIPGVFMIWLGGAALVTALIVTVLSELSWYVQVALFGVLSVFSILVGRRYYRGRELAGKEDGLNQRGQRLVGQVFSLTEAISNGSGRVKVGDSPWLVHGPEGLAKGARVRVIAVEGSALKVEATE